MSEKLIYLKGEASGFFKPKSLNSSGNFYFNNLDFQTIDVRNSLTVAPFILEELKIGFYHSSISPTKDVRVFINETDYIQQTINDFLFTDIKIGKELLIEGEKNIEYTATVYYILKKIIVDPSVIKSPVFFPTGGSREFSNVGVGNHENGSGRVAEPTNWIEKIQSPFNFGFLSILKYIFLSFILFSFLRSLFGLNFWVIGIPLFYLIYKLLKILRQNNGFTDRVLQTNYPILSYLGNFIVLLSLYSLFKHSLNISNSIFLLLGIGLVFISRSFKFTKIIGRILVLASIVIASSYLYESYKTSFKSSDDTDVPYEDTSDDKWEYKPVEETDSLKTDNLDTIAISYLKHKLSWKDNFRKAYQAKISVRKDQCNIARIHRDDIKVDASTSAAYFGKVYANLINQNKDYLNAVVSEYAKIGKNKQLSTKQFADMVVTSIQNIPYCLVHELTHAEADKQGGYVLEYHQSGGPCLDQTKFGIQAPVEFMGNFKGDCDTRSLFLYYVLSKLGFKVVVLVSEEYGHSILGISGNYSGDYITYKGLKYYGWETTNTGFTPGNMNPEVGNMRYWEVALGNNN